MENTTMRVLSLFLLTITIALGPVTRSLAQDGTLTFHYSFGNEGSKTLEGRLIVVQDSALVVYYGHAPDYRLLDDTANMATLPLASVSYIYEEPPEYRNTITGWAPLQGALLGAILGGIVLLVDLPEVDDTGDAAGALGIAIAQENPGTFMAITTAFGAALGLGALVYSAFAEKPEATIIYRQGDDLERLKELEYVR